MMWYYAMGAICSLLPMLALNVEGVIAGLSGVMSNTYLFFVLRSLAANFKEEQQKNLNADKNVPSVTRF